jgi:hypothetical protein
LRQSVEIVRARGYPRSLASGEIDTRFWSSIPSSRNGAVLGIGIADIASGPGQTSAGADKWSHLFEAQYDRKNKKFAVVPSQLPGRILSVWAVPQAAPTIAVAARCHLRYQHYTRP